MIHELYSTLPSFKTLQFQAGLNILVADKSPGSTELQSRNGAGKTSFLELIHFLFGSNVDKDSIFRSNVLMQERFGLRFDLKGVSTTIERSGNTPTRIIVRRGTTEDWPILPAPDRVTGELTIINDLWKTVLGNLVFGISFADAAISRGPTFRGLFGYFARRQQSGGFTTPVKHNEQQQLVEQQVFVSYLLGLDWTIPQRWQDIRDRERVLRDVRKAAGSGSLSALIGSVGELRSKLAVAEDANRRLRAEVSSFLVLPQYRSHEQESSSIARELGSISDNNTIDLQLIDELEETLAQEVAVPSDDLSRLYAEAGVSLPGVALRRFDEVKSFHDSIMQNRQSYLTGELENARRRIAERSSKQQQLANRQAEILALLQSHGALDQYNALQSELARREAEVQNLRQRFETAEALEGQKTALDLERGQLQLRLQQDYREQQETLQRAILAFAETSRALYEEAGVFTITESPNGPQFEFEIQRSKSKGISNMQIFCFDMMLMRLCSERGMGPGFLIHDSHLFDGVDERQVAKALQLGSDLSTRLGFQYIVTMNSDDIPKDLPANFDPR